MTMRIIVTTLVFSIAAHAVAAQTAGAARPNSRDRSR